MSGIKWTYQEDKVVVDANHNGLSYARITELLPNRTLSSIQQRGNKLKLKGCNRANSEFFKRNDEYSHYVLGYWLADGCIMYKTGGWYFSLVSNDYGHLEKIAQIMEVKTKIYYNSNKAFELRVGDKELVNNLMQLGAIYRKTNSIKINDLKFDPLQFNHLLRGYFDGDGGYQFSGYTKLNGRRSIAGIKFTGSENLIKSLYEYIKTKGVLDKDTRKNNCYYLSYYGSKMRQLLNFMYKGANISLERKHKIYNRGDKLNELYQT